MSTPTYGQQVKAARTEARWTLERLGQKVGVTRSELSHIEHDRHYPSPALAGRIEYHLGVRCPDVPQARIERAIIIGLHGGRTDGRHHKQWAIDQMIRALAGERYYPLFDEDWDKGIAP